MKHTQYMSTMAHVAYILTTGTREWKLALARVHRVRAPRCITVISFYPCLIDLILFSMGNVNPSPSNCLLVVFTSISASGTPKSSTDIHDGSVLEGHF